MRKWNRYINGNGLIYLKKKKQLSRRSIPYPTEVYLEIKQDIPSDPVLYPSQQGQLDYDEIKTKKLDVVQIYLLSSYHCFHYSL